MRIRLNDIFSTGNESDFVNWQVLTKGRVGKSLDIQKGMPYIKEINGRTPAINFHINPYKEDQVDTPWRDIVLQDSGQVIYFGDNKSERFRANETRGNKRVLEVLPLYFSQNSVEKNLAPPIIVTKTVKIGEKTGFRKFIGLGIISDAPELVYQYEKNGDRVFANYRFKVTLFSLGEEGELNWAWIDDRKDSSIPTEDCNAKAPAAWKKWINHGAEVLGSVQLKIRPYRIIPIVEQKKMPGKNRAIVHELLDIHYPDSTKDGVRFEAMAAFITELFFENQNYFTGWITQGVGDRGVDFVGRLDIGQDELAKTSVIVLGQSKRYKNPISGERLTRVASRMTRGYIGVVITLDTFTPAAQKEINDDKLPIILINGKKVAELLLKYLHTTNKSLSELVKQRDLWALSNVGTDHYDTILNY